MTANVHITHAEPIDGGLFVRFDDGQAAHFPASFLRSYVPWFEVDPPEGREIEPLDSATPSTARVP